MEKTTKKTKKRTAKRILSALIAIIVFFMINMVAANVIFHFIFARYDYNRALDYKGSNNPDIMITPEDITFYSDGNNLSGKIYYAENAKGNLIIAHGMHSYGDRYLAISEYFVNKGWNVITYDMTGTGDSEGSYTKGLSQMKIDLISAIDYVENEKSLCEYPIVLWGHSMGGYAVATALEERPEIAGAITISSFNTPTDIMQADSSKYVGILSTISYPFMWLQNELLFGKDANVDASDVLSHTNVPTLVVYGDSDDTVPLELSLFSHKEEIEAENKNISFYLIDEEFRSEHSTLWLEKDSAEYTLKIFSERDAIEDEYDGNVPDNVYNDFINSVNFDNLYILDLNFMDYTNDFLEGCL